MTYKKSENNVCEIFRIVYKSGLLSSTFIAMIIFLTGIVPTIQVVVYAKFIDDAILLISSDLNIAFMYNSFMLIIILISYQWISNELNKFFCVKLEIKIRENYRIKIVNKISRLEYKYIEDKETWELISRIMQNPESAIKNAYSNILNIISLCIRILGVLAILLVQVWWAAVLIVMISIPLFILANKSGKSNYEANREATKFRRKHEYLSEILSNRDSINERELFGFSKYINQEWYNNYEKAREVELKTQIKWFIKLKSGSIITTVLSIIIIFILLQPVIEGTISIGMYISLVSAVFGMIQMMSWKLTGYFDLLAKNNEYINDIRSLFRLASIDDTNDERDIKEFKFSSIEFKNVSFKYPNSNFYVLKDLTFKIEEGKHYSFVGINGAGKTTITKLMTGLYTEFEGNILINDVSIRDYSKESLKSIYSIAYQDFAKYYITIKDNILISDLSTTENEKLLSEILLNLDLNELVMKAPSGLNTPLGKIKMNGIDISGGEWQRIVMARAMYNKGVVRILDEPTAALDPISESNLYEKFEEISKNKTTIFISHRLGSTRLADMIFVLDGGKIIESGSHNELMILNGLYKKMFSAQRSWYK